MGLWTFACKDFWFESRRRLGSLSLVAVVPSQVAVSALGWSFVQRSSNECGVSECDRKASIMRRTWSPKGLCQERGGVDLLLCSWFIITTN